MSFNPKDIFCVSIFFKCSKDNAVCKRFFKNIKIPGSSTTNLKKNLKSTEFIYNEFKMNLTKIDKDINNISTNNTTKIH